MFNSSENIEPNSAVVIVDFARWSETYEDPIDTYNYKKIISTRPQILKGQIGLKKYLETLETERTAQNG